MMEVAVAAVSAVVVEGPQFKSSYVPQQGHGGMYLLLGTQVSSRKTSTLNKPYPLSEENRG